MISKNRRSKLPDRFERKFGELGFHGGIFAGKTLVSWDIVGVCAVEECPVYERCPAENKTNEHKCTVQMQYVKTASNTLLKAYAEEWDQFQLYGFGMHLTPLFVQLCKFKLVEAGLGLEDIICVGKSKYVHPIFKEIRETMKAIYYTAEKLAIDPKSVAGLTDLMKKKEKELLDLGSSGSNDDNDYVSELMKETEPVGDPFSMNFKTSLNNGK